MNELKTIDEYFIQTKKYKMEYGKDNTIVIMQVGSFYEIYALKVKHDADIQYLLNENKNTTNSLFSSFEEQKIMDNSQYFGNDLEVFYNITELAIAKKSNISYNIYVMEDNTIEYVHPDNNHLCLEKDETEKIDNNELHYSTQYFSQPQQKKIKRTIECDVYMCGFSVKEYIMEKYIQKLLQRGYTLPLFNQYDCHDNPTKKYRALFQILSTGTYFNDNSITLSNHICVIRFYLAKNSLFSMKENGKPKARNIGMNETLVVGMASMDIITGKSNYYEYAVKITDTSCDFDELECYISSYMPNEIICLFDSSLYYTRNGVKKYMTKSKTTEWLNYLEYDGTLIRYIDMKKETSMDGLQDTVLETNNNTKILAHTERNIQTNLQKRANNADKECYQVELLKLYFGNNVDIPAFYKRHNFYDNICSLHAYCFLLDYISKHNTKLVNNIVEPYMFKNDSNVIIANHSYKQLNYLSSKQATEMFYRGTKTELSNKLTSVVDFMCSCKTNMGKREIRNRLVRPTTNIEYLNQQYDMIEYFRENSICKELYHVFADFCDIDKHSTILSMGASKYDYKKLNTLISTIELFQPFFTGFITHLQNTTEKDSNISKVFGNLSKMELNNFITYMRNKFDFNVDNSTFLSTLTKNDYKQDPIFESTIQDYMSKNIFSNDEEINDIYNELTDKLCGLNAIREFICKMISLQENARNQSYTKMNGYCKFHKTDKDSISLRITNSRKIKLEKEMKELKKNSKMQQEIIYQNILDTTPDTQNTNNKTKKICININNMNYTKATSSVVSIESDEINEIIYEIKDIEQRYFDLIRDKYNNEIQYINNNFQPLLREITSFIVEYDITMTKANISKQYNYCKPNIVCNDKKTSYVDAKQIRHILIEQFLSNEIYVPNDIYLDNVNSTILFGTNAVGKSSLIKSIGINIILAQCGFYVPCSDFTYYPYQSLFTRILGNDDIFKGLSTFAVEMTEFNSILRHSNKNSLVLGDELCSGTEMSSAMSIFLAGIQALIHKECSFIFATHFHEILETSTFRNLENKLNIKHLSVEYDVEGMCLVYDRILKDGPGEQNYGIKVCRSLQLPDDFITQAMSIRDELNQNLKMKYHGNTKTICESGTSTYNKSKVKVKCEVCGNQNVDDVHHMQYQEDADSEGFIGHFHKNQKANLMTLCKKCHQEIHKKKRKIIRKKRVKV